MGTVARLSMNQAAYRPLDDPMEILEACLVNCPWWRPPYPAVFAFHDDDVSGKSSRHVEPQDMQLTEISLLHPIFVAPTGCRPTRMLRVRRYEESSVEVAAQQMSLAVERCTLAADWFLCTSCESSPVKGPGSSNHGTVVG